MRFNPLACALALLVSIPAFGDGGMWTFDNFPQQLVKTKYGVDIDAAWLERVRTATIRLSNCTASFVSATGLILTNHHCAEACLDDHSTAERNLVRDGFVARSREEELKCGTQIADVLMETQNVTAQVSAALNGLDEKAANDKRKQTLTQLEQQCEGDSRHGKFGPLKCESVDLYQGGQYWLYKYRRYDDVRLVFSPEDGIAAFGGDPDNFQFPRWCLDMAVLRAYGHDGKPAATPNFLAIRPQGPESGDVVFVSGHPGTTDRLLTVAQLETLRDLDLPRYLLRASELRGRYIQFGKSGAEAARIVEDPLNSLENSIKVRRKQLDALLDDRLLQAKREEEKALRDKLAAQAPLAAQIGDPWADSARAQVQVHELYLPYTYLEQAVGFHTQLFRYSRTLVFGRERMREWLGPDAPIVRQLLVKDSPDTLAARVVEGSKLGDPQVRKQLWDGGAAAVDAPNDPMIELARAVDAPARAVRKRYEDEVEAPEQAAAEKIARARFAIYGTSLPPDATFTLRLNFGTVTGWREGGREIEPFTHLRALFERATDQDPFRVPDSWNAARGQLDMDTRFNLSTSSDIVGGNSGSPLTGRNGRIVGLMFDGNIHSIAGSYWYDPELNRAVAVDPTIMLEGLRKVYKAQALLTELGWH